MTPSSHPQTPTHQERNPTGFLDEKEKQLNRNRRMSMRSRGALVAAAVGVLTVGGVVPASADTTGDTPATVTVTGGFLSITVPADAGSLGSCGNTVGGGTIGGPLGQVQVEDARQRVGRVRMGHQRHLLGLHSSRRTCPRGKPGRLFRRDDQQGRYRDVRGEQPHGPNGRRACGDRNRDHRRQLGYVEPDDHRDGSRWDGRGNVFRRHHALGSLGDVGRRRCAKCHPCFAMCSGRPRRGLSRTPVPWPW